MKYTTCRSIKVSGLMVMLILTAALNQHCNHDPIVEPPAGFVAGSVIDSLTGLPLEGPLLSRDSTFSRDSTLTDSLGNYGPLPEMPGTHRFICCTMENYAAQSREYSIASEVTTIVDFNLVPE